MNLILDGHHYKYELESLANMFFHENKVRVVTEKDFSQAEYLYTYFFPEPDGTVYAALDCQNLTRSCAKRNFAAGRGKTIWIVFANIICAACSTGNWKMPLAFRWLGEC